MVRFISLMMDVEDPINAASDDAALRCAQTLTDLGVTGCFCITGEKIRRLRALGRHDVLSALRRHATGLHTNTHSYHPTTMELLENLGWDDGIDAFRADLQPGLEAFSAVFGRTPLFWGGAGNTWGPQVAGALPTMGIPAYVYALPSPWYRRPYRFAGCVAFPGGIGIGEQNLEAEKPFERAMERVLEVVKSTRTPWLEVFIGHPTRIRHRSFWDADFFDGRTPEDPEFAEPYPEPVYEAMMERFSRAVAMLNKVRPVLGFDEVLALPWRFRPASRLQKDRASREWARGIAGLAKWPVNRPDLNPERLVLQAREHLASMEIADLE